MRKKQVEDYIPRALSALESCEIVSEGLIPKEFKGHIASFGAAIITNGLLPAIAFYQDRSEGKEKRNILMQAILYIIKKDDCHHRHCESLMDYVKGQQDRAEIKDKIMAAVVALKLAMRTFEFKEKGANG